ncbi:MAG TPA: exodeoxyribonuclease VII large subunit [Clostridiaceae bacterium]|nr:exodeoxyribonuclease VII large subunit [Clostridiaceae bacterium]
MNYILTVSEINKYIREIISRDLILSNLWVKGEISNFKHHYAGHLYFTIKDEKSLLKCVMFKSQASKLRFSPENGMNVIIKGYISVYERDGQYQLYVEEMQPDGVGDLHVAFEQLKQKLKEEGLFDENRKKRLPFLPRSIGVITSITGSVIKDIMNILDRRFYNIDLKIYPVQVQGEVAAGQIARAIRKINEARCVDVIILARGGGSLEELWPFNEEIVARSIADSNIPIISAVGHETDFTIADFVADVRAPTPSAAAELVVPEKSMLKARVNELDIRLKNAIHKFLRLKRNDLERLASSIPFRQPYNRVYQERMRLDILNRNMQRGIVSKIDKARTRLQFLIEKLNALSPLSILARGYSITKLKENGSIVKSVEGVNNGDELRISVYDGDIDCRVVNVFKGGGHEYR